MTPNCHTLKKLQKSVTIWAMTIWSHGLYTFAQITELAIGWGPVEDRTMIIFRSNLGVPNWDHKRVCG